ncbi:carcinoembryonic antigen-related cell adhesion molecule 2-like, partial [Engraulis encrasicolus]|uniref:carcinoembryonic antigen-related cell adhesion molecule 2-like n=1 Tax=Engraulis encrasicolus TaxID=184585 RepID=UPI002FD625B2
MNGVLGLLLLLLSAASTYGLDSVCDATRDASVCYGALGGPVMLQLNSSGYTLEFKNEKGRVFAIRTRKLLAPPSPLNWQVVADNGTLIINPAERNDSGIYTVEIIGNDGRTGKHIVSLMIEAPVSNLDLSISCSANGERRVSCSSNGDSPEFSWSLDGRALSGADADLSAGNQTVLLKGNVIGQLSCTVSNHVSTANITKLTRCPGESTTVCVSTANPPASTSPPATSESYKYTVAIVTSSLVMMLVILCLAMVYIWKRKQNKTHTPAAGPERKDEDEELVYIQVTATSRGGGRADRKREVEDVVYSDVAMERRRSRRKSRKPSAGQ